MLREGKTTGEIMNKWLKLAASAMGGGIGIPKGVVPVSGFDAGRYLGVWYEIARLPTVFQEGLTRVSATYTARDDGGIRVINRGFAAASGQWQQIEGQAYFIAGPEIGRLKVSFFGPFYGSYNIIALDEAYANAMVCGPRLSDLWILAQAPVQDPAVTAAMVTQAQGLGFATEKLIFAAS